MRRAKRELDQENVDLKTAMKNAQVSVAGSLCDIQHMHVQVHVHVYSSNMYIHCSYMYKYVTTLYMYNIHVVHVYDCNSHACSTVYK